MENRNAYLFIWNHENWHIDKLIPKIDEVRISGKATDEWGITGHKKVRIGDRAFITKVNDKIKGIFASGKIVAKDFMFLNHSNISVHGVVIEFDTFVHPIEDQILNIEIIKSSAPVKQKWPPQSSGTQIKPENVGELENLWERFCVETNVYKNIAVYEQTITEGASYEIIQTIYERNQYARTLCLKHHGYSCAVCDFNFEDVYGVIGKEFIHVHHLNQLSNIGEKHETNPMVDLRPVCPNCHAMLHKVNPPFTIEELKAKIKTSLPRG
jgi:5-methylcytosine-specific restriction protein A